MPFIRYNRGGQITARRPNVARHRVFSGPPKHSRKSSNLKYPRTQHSKKNVEANLN